MAETIDTSTTELRSHVVAITDELSRASSFISAAYMATNALTVDQERDALQEVLDEADRRIAEARRLVTECIPQRAA